MIRGDFTKNKLLIIISIIITILWMLIIYNFSETSSVDSNNSSKAIIRNIVEKFVHDEKEVSKLVIKINKPFRKCAHASVYFVLGLFVNSIILYFNKNIKICNLISIIFCYIYASFDEFHQTFVVGRTGQISDVLIDGFGAIMGCIIFNLLYKKVKDKKTCN